MGALLLRAAPASDAPILFEMKTLPFRLENSETQARNAPETMPGGVAVFDYNGDGRTDLIWRLTAPSTLMTWQM